MLSSLSSPSLLRSVYFVVLLQTPGNPISFQEDESSRSFRPPVFFLVFSRECSKSRSLCPLRFVSIHWFRVPVEEWLCVLLRNPRKTQFTAYRLYTRPLFSYTSWCDFMAEENCIPPSIMVPPLDLDWRQTFSCSQICLRGGEYRWLPNSRLLQCSFVQYILYFKKITNKKDLRRYSWDAEGWMNNWIKFIDEGNEINAMYCTRNTRNYRRWSRTRDNYRIG